MPKLPHALCIALCCAQPAEAEDRVTLGFGRLFNNDVIGDGHDRWRTGSYTVSVVRGADWDGALPAQAGALLEYRLRAEIIAPSDLVDPPPGDRRYAGALSFGLHTHFAMGAAEVSAGGDLVVTGPQTGLGRFQSNIHDWFGLDDPQVLDDQIGNAVHPTLLAEVGQSFRMGDRTTLRPFAAAQAGVESLLRVGGDLTFGGFGSGALMLRDVTTGQRYVSVKGTAPPGMSLTLGGDVAHVFDSAYLPSGGPAVLADARSRVRAGVHWQGDAADAFYGVTWLGEEFEDQPDTQIVGSLRVNLRF